MPFAILIGQTLTLPAREITDGLIRAKQDWVRAHNMTGSIRYDLKSGEKAKIVSAYERKPGRDWDAILDVSFDENEVRVTGIARGFTQVEIVDELSAPGGTTGMAGGVEVLVQDEVDRQVMMQSVQSEMSAQDAAAEHRLT